MERKTKISLQQVRFYTAAKDSDSWITSHDLAMKAKIAERTARAFAKTFVLLGLLEVRAVFPGHRYRFSKLARKQSPAYLRQLEQACGAFQDIGSES